MQSIERRVISQRIAPVNESQVGHYAPSICQTMTTGSGCPCCCVQEIERIYIEDDCCVPAVNCCCCPQTCVGISLTALSSIHAYAFRNLLSLFVSHDSFSLDCSTIGPIYMFSSTTIVSNRLLY